MISSVIAAGATAAAAIGAAPSAAADGPYANCTQAHNDGRWDILQGDPDYWPAGVATTTASPASPDA